jgi:prepilin-type N-terminal cleavage/methylation domain-containing protein
MNFKSKYRTSKIARMAGFTLLELMLAMAMFVIVMGAVFLLFRQAMPTYANQQNLAGLNISVQNAVAQLQQDLVNAGTGYYSGSNIPSWPVGVSVINNSDTTSCVTGSPWTYSSGCFDTLNIITSDPNTPAQHPNTVNTNTATSLTITPSGVTAATLGGDYQVGDELLLVSSSGLMMTTIKVSAVSHTATTVTVTFASTNSDGTNSTTNDPLGITTHASTVDNGAAVFGVSYSTSDWILRLQPITYSVSVATPSNPVLQRTQGGTTNVLAQQIIGFRVGASLWNHASDTGGQTYSYQASTYGTGYDFTIIRAIRVSMIGRTTPASGDTGVYNYQNNFDGGPYQVIGAAVIVNPRNLSMTDN